MLRVTVELLPFGDEKGKRVISTGDIVNMADHPNRPERGNYHVSFNVTGMGWSGKVIDYPRDKGALELLRRALNVLSLEWGERADVPLIESFSEEELDIPTRCTPLLQHSYRAEAHGDQLFCNYCHTPIDSDDAECCDRKMQQVYLLALCRVSDELHDPSGERWCDRRKKDRKLLEALTKFVDDTIDFEGMENEVNG